MEINCDLGEGVAGEKDIFPWIDAASIACGGHFGNDESIRKSLELAVRFDKKVGAHPSYPDRTNFGRVSMRMNPVQLIESIDRQISSFVKMLAQTDLQMDHIKCHGALYNDAAADQQLADALTDYFKSAHADTPVFVPPYSQMEKFALAKEVPIRLEIFGDRAYSEDYMLRPRTAPGSLLTEPEQVETHLESIIERNLIRVDAAIQIPIFAQTLCFHGDNPGLLTFLPKIRNRWWT